MEEKIRFGEHIHWTIDGRSVIICDSQIFLDKIASVYTTLPASKPALLKQFQLHGFKKKRAPKKEQRWELTQKDGLFVRSLGPTPTPRSDLVDKLHKEKRERRRDTRTRKRKRKREAITGSSDDTTHLLQLQSQVETLKKQKSLLFTALQSFGITTMEQVTAHVKSLPLAKMDDSNGQSPSDSPSFDEEGVRMCMPLAVQIRQEDQQEDHQRKRRKLLAPSSSARVPSTHTSSFSDFSSGNITHPPTSIFDGVDDDFIDWLAK